MMLRFGTGAGKGLHRLPAKSSACPSRICGARMGMAPKLLEAPLMTMMFFVSILLFFGLRGMEGMTEMMSAFMRSDRLRKRDRKSFSLKPVPTRPMNLDFLPS
jgi:hypothetical protein